MVAPLKVGIAGLGTVGAEVVRLIEQQGRTLAARCGRGVQVVAGPDGSNLVAYLKRPKS